MANLNQDKIVLIKRMIANAERSIQAAKQILEQTDDYKSKTKFSNHDQIIEGIFNGEKMISLDGKSYPVPANYASKSKLVEGDVLKLTITEDNSFIYKQVGPVERKKVIGTLSVDKKNHFQVLADGKRYQVLSASVSYFNAQLGDQITLVIPKEKSSFWGAIENVVSKSDAGGNHNINNLNNFNDKQGDDLEELLKEKTREESIQDEWTPDLEELKKEMSNEHNNNIDDELN